MTDEHNPYTPPKAQLFDAASSATGELSASRPTAVNIALFLMGVDILLSTGGIVGALSEFNIGARSVVVLASGGFDIGISALLCLYVARGRNWARIVFLTLTMFSLFVLLLGLYMAGIAGLPAGVAYATSWSNLARIGTPYLLSLAIVVMLFGPGRSWFRQRTLE